MEKTKKKKIAFYIDSLNRGGTEKATVDLINHLNYDKYDVTLIKFFPGGEYNKKVRKEVKNKTVFPIIRLFGWNKQVKHRVNWWGRNFYNRLPGKIRHKILIGNKYDVEVACGYFFPTRFIEDSPKAKKISWVHMDYEIDKSDIGNFTKEEGQKFFGKMDKIVCVSKECEEKFNRKFSMRDRTTTRYNIIDTEEIVQKSFENEETEKIFRKGRRNMIAVGRLTWQKGFDRLLKVHKKLIDDGLIHNLYIIGEGEDKEKLEQYIEENHLKETAFLLGYKTNPYPYIKNADLFICSSRHESFCLVLAESIILGTPVMSTSCTGPNELLDYGRFGLLVENNEEGIYQGLKRVLSENHVLEDLREQGDKRRDFFDTKANTEKWEELLDE